MCIALIVFLAATEPASLKDPSMYGAALFVVVLFLAHHLTAKGARDKKPWARVSSIAISIFMLIGFPVGTLIGIYLLSNTWNEWDQDANPGVVRA